MRREQPGSGIDAIPGKHTRTTVEVPIENRAWRVGVAPLRQERFIVALATTRPEHPAMKLGQSAIETTGQPLEIAFQRLRAFVVRDRDDNLATRFAGIEGARQQGARLIALASRQYQHLRELHRLRRFGRDIEPRTFEGISPGLERLHARQCLADAECVQSGAFACAQEQDPRSGSQVPLRERQQQRIERGIGFHAAGFKSGTCDVALSAHPAADTD